LRYHDTDGTTALAAIEELRRTGYVLPNWITRATAAGQLVTDTVAITSVAGSILPLPAMTALAYDRTDLGIATRVVARGQVRQVRDATQGGSITEIAPTAGGLPAVVNHQVTLGSTAYTLAGVAVRSGGSGGDYVFTLDRLLQRGQSPSTSGKALRPWGWYYHAPESTAGRDAVRALAAGWQEKLLCRIDLAETVEVAAIELHGHNPWWTDKTDWGGNRHNAFINSTALGKPPAHAEPQVLTVEYFDAAQNDWRYLASHLSCAVESPLVLRVESADFGQLGG
jgi:hypothetical protein